MDGILPTPGPGGGRSKLDERSGRRALPEVHDPKLGAPEWMLPVVGAAGGALTAGLLAARLLSVGGAPLRAALVGVGAIAGALGSIGIREAVRHADPVAGAGPTGPPAGATLAKRFPHANIPDVMVGTSIDKDAWSLTDHEAPASERAAFLMDRAVAMGANTVRLGAYWNEIQPAEGGAPNYEVLDSLLDAAKERGVHVVLTVGSKAPSWPEMYAPDWAKPEGSDGNWSHDPKFVERSTEFVRQVADHVKDREEIAMWQVENEPLEQFWEMPYLGADHVADEARILREADGGRRPVMVNVWAQQESVVFQNDLDAAFRIADVVGVDSYTHTPVEFGRHDREVDQPRRIMAMSRQTGVPAMITELQADDWHESSGAHFSTSADRVRDLTKSLHGSGYQDVLFWRLRMNQLEERDTGKQTLTDTERDLSRWLQAEGAKHT